MSMPPLGQSRSGIDIEFVLKRMNEVIAEAMVIEKTIGSTSQPPSQLEIGRLKELGLEYGQLHRQLVQSGHAPADNGV